ncbi:conserved hypothetical protein [Trichinella spiralis]|uniref:hypothetical protein n=1 Tax=Trichinella spiralis TaxID=6334 RepID=UPI0001EFC596|nr:conserved hypothetical protein [Trichinella spiralis]
MLVFRLQSQYKVVLPGRRYRSYSAAGLSFYVRYTVPWPLASSSWSSASLSSLSLPLQFVPSNKNKLLLYCSALNAASFLFFSTASPTQSFIRQQQHVDVKRCVD